MRSDGENLLKCKVESTEQETSNQVRQALTGNRAVRVVGKQFDTCHPQSIFMEEIMGLDFGIFIFMAIVFVAGILVGRWTKQ